MYLNEKNVCVICVIFLMERFVICNLELFNKCLSILNCCCNVNGLEFLKVIEFVVWICKYDKIFIIVFFNVKDKLFEFFFIRVSNRDRVWMVILGKVFFWLLKMLFINWFIVFFELNLKVVLFWIFLIKFRCEWIIFK